jgi:hypothetical protein
MKPDFVLPTVYTGTGTTDTLATNTNFDGGGIRVGIDVQRFAGNSRFMV